MKTKRITNPKLPEIVINYCSGIQEAYNDVLLKHNLNMTLELIHENEAVHGFTICNELDDEINIYLDETTDAEIYTKVAIHEALNAAISLIRRKIYYSYDDKHPVVLGEDPLVDDIIFDLLSRICTKVLLKKYQGK